VAQSQCYCTWYKRLLWFATPFMLIAQKLIRKRENTESYILSKKTQQQINGEKGKKKFHTNLMQYIITVFWSQHIFMIQNLCSYEQETTSADLFLMTEDVVPPRLNWSFQRPPRSHCFPRVYYLQALYVDHQVWTSHFVISMHVDSLPSWLPQYLQGSGSSAG